MNRFTRMSWYVLAFGFQTLPGFGAEPSPQLEALQRRVLEQESLLHQQQAALLQLTQRLARLEARLGASEDTAARETAEFTRVDLEPDELARAPGVEAPDHVLAREWQRNIRIDGFGAAGFVYMAQVLKA